MASERRKHKRIAIHIDSYCKGTAKAGMGRVSDLSAAGCRITSSLPLVVGDQAVFTFYFSRGGPMTILGRIVSIGSKGVGVKFENVTPSLAFQIREAIAAMDEVRI